MTDSAIGAPVDEYVVGKNDKLVILASSVGTVIEWYDFYLYGSLAAIITVQFFSGVNETTGYIFALMAFAAGFAVRPFGAVVFGRLGDLWGRKNTFLVTMLLMGLSTFVVGLLPPYAAIGIAAPIILVLMRLIQGLALGGEYGGAATYVAEHAPHGKRGFYTSFIQITATAGLVLSLVVILGVRVSVGEEAFAEWGWRIPFLVSILLLGVSLWIRLKLSESPSFKRMKAEGKGSKTPLKDSFGKWPNLKLVLIALLGLTAGQAVIWYTGQFYALFFLERVMKLDATLVYVMLTIALVAASPFFIFWGWLSDKVGRKPVILAGCLIAALTYFPLFNALTQAANPRLAAAAASAPDDQDLGLSEPGHLAAAGLRSVLPTARRDDPFRPGWLDQFQDDGLWPPLRHRRRGGGRRCGHAARPHQPADAGRAPGHPLRSFDLVRAADRTAPQEGGRSGSRSGLRPVQPLPAHPLKTAAASLGALDDKKGAGGSRRRPLFASDMSISSCSAGAVASASPLPSSARCSCR